MTAIHRSAWVRARFVLGFVVASLLVLACGPERSIKEDYAHLQILEYDHRATPARERIVLRRDEETGRCAAGIYAPERGTRIWFLLNGSELLQVPGGGTAITEEEAETLRAFCPLRAAAEERLALMIAAPRPAPESLAPDALSNERFFALARAHLEATPAAHPLLDLTKGTRNESRVLTRTKIRVTVVFTFGLAADDAGHTATVEMNPAGDLLAVTISWNPAFDGPAP